MENFYTAYTKVIENKIHYFVKKFMIFPEFKDVAPVLESYGMHTDFDKACHIAMIDDKVTKEQLLNSLEQNLNTAKLIQMNGDKVVNDKQKAI